MIAVFTTSGYLMQAVVEEKENYTWRCCSPRSRPAVDGRQDHQHGGGRLDAAAGVGRVGHRGALDRAELFGRTGCLTDFAGLVAISVAAFIPSFVMIAALMVAIGVQSLMCRKAIRSPASSPYGGDPYWFTVLILTIPMGRWRSLEFLPLYAPVTLSMRAGMTVIPLGQLFLTWLSCGCGVRRCGSPGGHSAGNVAHASGYPGARSSPGQPGGWRHEQDTLVIARRSSTRSPGGHFS